MNVSNRYEHADRTLMTTSDVVREFPELGVSQQALRIWARKGQIPCVRLPSGRLRFRRSDIEGLLEPRRGGVPRQAEVPRGGGQSRARAGASRSSSPASSSVSAVSASVGGGLW